VIIPETPSTQSLRHTCKTQKLIQHNQINKSNKQIESERERGYRCVIVAMAFSEKVTFLDFFSGIEDC